jgi:hypothetical protein
LALRGMWRTCSHAQTSPPPVSVQRWFRSSTSRCRRRARVKVGPRTWRRNSGASSSTSRSAGGKAPCRACPSKEKGQCVRRPAIELASGVTNHLGGASGSDFALHFKNRSTCLPFPFCKMVMEPFHLPPWLVSRPKSTRSSQRPSTKPTTLASASAACSSGRTRGRK